MYLKIIFGIYTRCDMVVTKDLTMITMAVSFLLRVTVHGCWQMNMKTSLTLTE